MGLEGRNLGGNIQIDMQPEGCLFFLAFMSVENKPLGQETKHLMHIHAYVSYNRLGKVRSL